ncbi:MAG: hypothetical protein FJX59_17065 [Alphaproteobacteria bacterium]|nr:hypothetical protein [Alphaproteobacteria bacterium]
MRRTHPHVLCFAPYTDWSIHSAREVTILQALRLRGCTVTYVTCDSMLTDCDLLQQSKGGPAKKPANACLICQANTATKLAAWGMPYSWLGRWQMPEDKSIAARWVASLRPADYPTARYKEWPIGEWIRSSVHTHFRVMTFDLANESLAATFGSYLFSGLLTALALDRLFDEQKPDIQLLFNGRMGPVRIALEFARRRGIRTICEERSALAGRLMLFDNESCLNLGGPQKLWPIWRDQALDGGEINEIGEVFEERWQGRANEVTVFSRGIDRTDVHKALGFSKDRPLWALFSSSIDETADMPNIEGTFPSQESWITAVTELARAREDIQLAIRIHPNVDSKKSLGRGATDIAFFANLEPQLPKNVRLIPSRSDLSSYALAAAADLGLVWYSTIGLEMAAMGRPVIRAASYWLHGCGFMPKPGQPDDLAQLLDQMSRPLSTDARRSLAVQAWRFAHMWYFRQSIPFPLVRQPKWYVGEIAWASLDELAPGRDCHLDRICDMFLADRPVHSDIVPARSTSVAEESAAVWDRLTVALGRDPAAR